MRGELFEEWQKYKCMCTICDVYIYQSTKHCMPCNKCVELYDHHCAWLNNCIGKHNYKPFFKLIISFTIYLASYLYLLARTFEITVHLDTWRTDHMVGSIFLLVAACANTVSFILITVLLTFHLNL